MTTNPDFTAYVLGELTAAERVAVERGLLQDPDARAEVDQLRATLSLLHGEWDALPSLQLNPEQRAVVIAAGQTQSTPSRSTFGLLRFGVFAASAAAALLMVSLSTGPISPGIESIEQPHTRLFVMDATPQPDAIAAATAPYAWDLGTHEEWAGAVKSGSFAALATSTEPAQAISFDGALKVKLARIRLDYTPADRVALLAGGPAGNGAHLAELLPNHFSSYLTYGASSKDLARFIAPRNLVSGARIGRYLLQDVNVPLLVSAIDPQKLTWPQFKSHGSSANSTWSEVAENPFQSARETPRSTFSFVTHSDGLTYVADKIAAGEVPSPTSVRVEGLVNAFRYSNFVAPEGAPFGADVEVATCAWKPEHRLVRVGLSGVAAAPSAVSATNFVFLIDTSKSMQAGNKLPLLRQSMRLFVDTLGKQDRIGIVTFDSKARVSLPSVSCADPARVLTAIDKLHADGPRNAGVGFQLAFDMASQNFVAQGVNRVILATDQAFAPTLESRPELKRIVAQRAEQDVPLTVLAVGTDRPRAVAMDPLVVQARGGYTLVRNSQQAQRVLLDQKQKNVVPASYDLHVQVQFNPLRAGAYRLIGYENSVRLGGRLSENAVSSGTLRAGQTVTALYEVVPAHANGGSNGVLVDPSDPTSKGVAWSASGALLTLHVRSRVSATAQIQEFEKRFGDRGTALKHSSADFQFASAVASYGMILRRSRYKGTSTLKSVLQLATRGTDAKRQPERQAFLDLVRRTQAVLPGQ